MGSRATLIFSIAGIFTVVAAGAWYALAFVVRPLFG